MSATQPSQPWAPGQPVAAARLEQMRGAVMHFTVASPLKMIRNGNSVAISITEQIIPRVRSPVTVIISTAASGGGKYNGRVWINPKSDVSASGTLAIADLGTDPGADNALILNRQEVGKATHDLTTSPVTVTFFGGEIIRINSDGKYVVAIDGTDWKDCT